MSLVSVKRKKNIRDNGTLYSQQPDCVSSAAYCIYTCSVLQHVHINTHIIHNDAARTSVFDLICAASRTSRIVVVPGRRRRDRSRHDAMRSVVVVFVRACMRAGCTNVCRGFKDSL